MLLSQGQSSDDLRAKTQITVSASSPNKFNHRSGGLRSSEKTQTMGYVNLSGKSKSVAGEHHVSDKSMTDEEQKNEINRFGIKIDMSRETIDQVTDYEDQGYKPRETLFRQSGITLNKDGQSLMTSEVDMRTDGDSSQGPFCRQVKRTSDNTQEDAKIDFHEEVQVVDDMFNTNETDQQIRLSHFQTENGTKWFAKEQTSGTDSI